VKLGVVNRLHSRTREAVTEVPSATTQQHLQDDDGIYDHDTRDNDDMKLFRRIHIIRIENDMTYVDLRVSSSLVVNVVYKTFYAFETGISPRSRLYV
jgi:hypothetical protein